MDFPIADRLGQDASYRELGTRGKKGGPHPEPGDPPQRRADKRRGHGTSAKDRPPVTGVVGRESGGLRLEVVEHSDRETLEDGVDRTTLEGATVYTDEWRATPLTFSDVEPMFRAQAVTPYRLVLGTRLPADSTASFSRFPVFSDRFRADRPPRSRRARLARATRGKQPVNTAANALRPGLATQVAINKRLESKVNGVEWRGYGRLAGMRHGHATMSHIDREWARDNDGDGVRKVHDNTREGIWTELRNLLRTFRGVSSHDMIQHTRISHRHTSSRR